jgi:hypothetical protein
MGLYSNGYMVLAKVNAESMLRHHRIVNATEWVSILEAISASGNFYDLWWCLTVQTVSNPR